jgi:hypothetical protein
MICEGTRVLHHLQGLCIVDEIGGKQYEYSSRNDILKKGKNQEGSLLGERP